MPQKRKKRRSRAKKAPESSAAPSPAAAEETDASAEEAAPPAAETPEASSDAAPPPEAEEHESPGDESPEDEVPADPGAKVQRRRGWGCCGALVIGVLPAVLLAGGIGAGWWSGHLPRYAVQAGLERVLQAKITTGEVSIGKKVWLERIVVSQPEYGDTVPDSLVVEGLSLDYNLRPEDGRFIDSVECDAIYFQTDVTLDPPSHHWLEQFLARPGDGSGKFTPKVLRIGELGVGYKSADFIVGVRGLGLEGKLPYPGRTELHFRGDAVQLIEQGRQWWGLLPDEEAPEEPSEEEATPEAIGEWTPAQTFEGRADWRLVLSDGGIETGGEIDIPGAASVAASVSLTRPEQGFAGKVEVGHFHLEQPVWGAFLSFFSPVPLGFAALTLEHLEGAGGIYADAFALDRAQAAGTVAALRVGAADAPYFTGDLAFRGEGASAAGRAGFQGEVSSGERPPVAVSFAGMPDEWQLDIQTPAWDRAGIASVSPLGAAWLEEADTLETLGGSALVHYVDGQFRFEAALEGRFGDDDAALRAEGHYAPQTEEIRAEVNLAMLGGAAAGPLAWESIEAFEWPLALRNVEPRAWMKALLGSDALAAYGLPFTGNVALNGAGELVRFEGQGELARATWDGREVSDGLKPKVRASGAFNRSAGTAEGSRIQVAAGEVLDAELRQWHFNPAAGRFRGTLDGTIDLAYVSRTFGPEGLWGSLRAQGPVSWRPAGLEWEGRADSEEFGFGDWATPYRAVTHGEAKVRVSPEGRVVIAPLSVTMGEQAEATAASVEVELEEGGPMLEAVDLEVRMNLQPLVSYGFFAAGDGRLEMSFPQAKYEDDTWTGQVATLFDAVALTLPGAVARLENTELTGNFGFDDGLSGGGQLRIGGLNIGGTQLSDLVTGVRAEGAHLYFDDLASGLFQGRVEGRAEVDVFDPAYPLRLELEATDLELERFTAEFEPPDTELTGKVSGEAMIALGLDGLKDLRVRLEAPDGITLNRSMVELILLSQQVGDFTAGGTLSRVVQRVVGDAEHRPFESAVLRLGFENGRITGVAELRSRTLNLTVDIAADPGALAEALRIRAQ